MQQRSLFDSAAVQIQNSLPVDVSWQGAPLYVQDTTGLRLATPREILDASRRAIDASMPKGVPMSQPRQVKDYFLAKLGGMRREVMGIVYLNHQLQLIAYEEPFGGTLAECSVYPREIVKRALELNTGAVIVGHPHPSGTAAASDADVVITKRIKQALELVDIRLVDHVIVAGDQVVSLVEARLM